MQIGSESGIISNLSKLLPFSASVLYSQEKLVKLSTFKIILFLCEMQRKSKNCHSKNFQLSTWHQEAAVLDLCFCTWIRKRSSRGHTLPGAGRKHWGWVPLWPWMSHDGSSWKHVYNFKAGDPRPATIPRLLIVLSNFLYPACHSEYAHLLSSRFTCGKSRHRWTQ